MSFYFHPGAFLLGGAAGVLTLVLVLSLIISFAYEERTLLALASFLALMVAAPPLLTRLGLADAPVQQAMLVLGPTATVAGQVWLMRERKTRTGIQLALGAMLAAGLGLVCSFGSSVDDALKHIASYAWSGVVLALSAYVVAQQRAVAGPWIWWYLAGSVAGLGAATAFLSGQAQAEQVFWPQVLMHFVQAPPIYLALVWRSRLLNESQHRSASAKVTDPLTGLATSTVLVERLMRLASHGSRRGRVSALFLIEVQNWYSLLAELGEEFKEKLLLEAALRLRRAIGDNDLAVRVGGGRFAVVAQGMAGQLEVSALATRLVVSGLRIDSPALKGVEFKFRIVVSGLTAELVSDLPTTKLWLSELTENFNHWPPSHSARSILTVSSSHSKLAPLGAHGAWDVDSEITSDMAHNL